MDATGDRERQQELQHQLDRKASRSRICALWGHVVLLPFPIRMVSFPVKLFKMV